MTATIRRAVLALNNEHFKNVLYRALPDRFTFTARGKMVVFGDVEEQLVRLREGYYTLELYTSSWFTRRTVGYVSKKFPRKIFLNSRHALSVKNMGAFLIHELCHKAGYNHGVGKTANCLRWYCNPSKKYKSVPYTFGKKTEAILEATLKGEL